MTSTSQEIAVSKSDDLKSTSVSGSVDILDVDDREDASQVEGRTSFSLRSAFGLAFSVINSWVVLVVGLGSGLVSGGPSALVWGFLYASICNFATVLSHGEVFAVYPTAGGQYHWAALIAPPRMKNSLSWLTGMLNIIGLWMGAATAGYLATVLLLSIIAVNDPNFIFTAGKQYGIFVAIVLFGPVLTILLGPVANRWLDQGLMVLSVLGALAIIITLPATTPQYSSAKFVFGGLSNLTGWNSVAIAWMLGLLQSAFAYLGFDLIYHISEEMPRPRTQGPKAVNLTIGVSAISGMAVLLAILFCIPDLEAVISTSYILPFAQICMNSTGSRAATTILLLVPMILFLNSVRGIVITASRVLLALGRDNVLPRPRIWGILWRGEPIVGLLISIIIPLLCGLVQLGPASAFNSLLGGATIIFEWSYVIPPALMLFGGRRRLNKAYPERTSNLGRWGVPCNMIAAFFVVQSTIIYCFPATLPVTPSNMSYVVVYLAAFAGLLAVLWYTWARKRYVAPTEEAIQAIINRRPTSRSEIET